MKSASVKNDENETLEEGVSFLLDLDPNEVIEADDENLPYAEKDLYDPEQDEIPKTRQSSGATLAWKYNLYGDDFVVDRIDLMKITEKIVGLEVREQSRQRKWTSLTIGTTNCRGPIQT